MDDGLIRAVARAFAVLRLMNTEQRWTIHELHGQTRLPKSTLFRILATLQQEGYVRVDPARGQYTLSAKVHELSAGYSEQSRVVTAGAPITLRVTRGIKWPLAIGVRDGEAMVVAHSTMPYSPLAVHSSTVGHRLAMGQSAMGQAYLAHCSDAERHELLVLLAAEATEARVDPALTALLARVAADGFAVRRPDQPGQSATLAVPICHQGEAIAALGMTTFGRTMSARFVQQHLPTLQQTAAEIGSSYASFEGSGTR